MKGICPRCNAAVPVKYWEPIIEEKSPEHNPKNYVAQFHYIDEAKGFFCDGSGYGVREVINLDEELGAIHQSECHEWCNADNLS